jgi:hypothetical protein
LLRVKIQEQGIGTRSGAVSTAGAFTMEAQNNQMSSKDCFKAIQMVSEQISKLGARWHEERPRYSTYRQPSQNEWYNQRSGNQRGWNQNGQSSDSRQGRGYFERNNHNNSQQGDRKRRNNFRGDFQQGRNEPGQPDGKARNGSMWKQLQRKF